MRNRVNILIAAWILFFWTASVFIFAQIVYRNSFVPKDFSHVTAAADTVAYINQIRSANNLKALKHSDKLDGVAKNKACDMAKRNYFDHQDPDGKMPWHLFEEAGYRYNYAGENLASGMVGQVQAMHWLMNSLEHRDNILFENYTEVGTATCGIYYVQEFGQPE